MDVAVFSEAATPRSTLKKASRFSERLDSSRRRLLDTGSINRNNTPRIQNEENNSPVYSQRSTSASTRKRSTGSRGKSKRAKPSDGDQDVVTTTTYQLPQFTDNEIDWASMSPPQSKFQLKRTPVKKITINDDESRGEVREDNKKSNNNSEVVATVNISHVINNQHVTSSIDPVTDHIVVDNEVTIVTDVTDNDDGSNIVASTEHSEVVQSSSNISILIPSHKEDVAPLPATLQCTDNDLAYLERMANIKLLKELTHKSSQLDKELKSVKQQVEEVEYKCQKTDEEYDSLSTTYKRTAIMVHHFLNNKHLDTIPEVSTVELQAAGDVTLDKKTIEQLKQEHKELKVQMQTANRTLERQKTTLEKQKEQNKETVEKTAALQAEKEQLMTKLKEMDQQEDELREQIASLQQQQQLEDKKYEEQNCYFRRQLEILKERCELYKQRENNMKQISDYMDGLERRTKLRQKKTYRFL